MKTQYVGVIFTNDIQPGTNAKTYYFKDNLGAVIGDELVVRCTTGRLAVVEVVTVSDVAPSERLLNSHQLCATLCKVDKSGEEKYKRYQKNKCDAHRMFEDVITECMHKLNISRAARTLLRTLPTEKNNSIWEIFFEAERLLKEAESYEKEHGICE